jgi:hypothetical protein
VTYSIFIYELLKKRKNKVGNSMKTLFRDGNFVS